MTDVNAGEQKAEGRPGAGAELVQGMAEAKARRVEEGELGALAHADDRRPGRPRRRDHGAEVARPFLQGRRPLDRVGESGPAHVDVDHVLSAFPDVDEITTDCPRGCTHLASEPECALDAAVAAGTLSVARVDSLRRILAARLG